MASGFFALFDDIAVLMDDVATMSKVATRKTAGLLADDLAVNAEKASGFVSARELPILWRITKGSFLNKLIILPVAFLLSEYLPIAVTIILLCGGVYLAYEGAEKVYEYLFHRGHKKEGLKVKDMSKEELTEYENKKIKSAILVDFILSVEIVILALSTVIESDIAVRIASVTLVAVLATIGVYGLVALLVRMDDLGYKMIANSESENSFSHKLGMGLVKTLPVLIRGLTILGTLAMLLVGGGIFVHNIHFIHDLVHALPTILGEFIVGLVVGIIALAIVSLFKKITGKKGH
ncbi:MAG: DUF808 domain-containing protein [Cyclobacteriaceae bacterium]